MSSRITHNHNGKEHLMGLSLDGPEIEEILSSKKRQHYNRALKEMHELVKLESLRMHWSRSCSDEDLETERRQDNEMAGDVSGVSSERLDYEQTTQRVYKTNGRTVLEQNSNGSRQQTRIYKELWEISKGLQSENERLKKWEADLEEKTAHSNLLKKRLREYESALDELIEYESQKRCNEFEKTFEERTMELTEDCKRTKLSFKVMKQANETLKKKNAHIEEHNRKLEEKVSSMSNRISNLQRRNEILQKQLDEKSIAESSKNTTKEGDHSEIESRKRAKQIQIEIDAFLEILGVCLHWIAESQLKPSVQSLIVNKLSENGQNDVVTEIASEKALKVVQQLPPILQYLSHWKILLPFLQFVYWSLLHAEFTQNRKGGLPLTAFRRIGEDLFRTQISRRTSKPSADVAKKKLGEQTALIFKSDTEAKMLSEFIVLKTVSQADIVAKAFEALKLDTRKDEGLLPPRLMFQKLTSKMMLDPVFPPTGWGKEIFIGYYGSAVLFPFLSAPQKGVLNITVDVLMQMTVESPFLGKFLESLSTQSWIKILCELFQSKSVDNSAMEKLSIISQRLSKIKSNHKYFESINFVKVIRNLAASCYEERPFFALNLRSILLNLNTKGPLAGDLRKIAR